MCYPFTILTIWIKLGTIVAYDMVAMANRAASHMKIHSWS